MVAITINTATAVRSTVLCKLLFHDTARKLDVCRTNLIDGRHLEGASEAVIENLDNSIIMLNVCKGLPMGIDTPENCQRLGTAVLLASNALNEFAADNNHIDEEVDIAADEIHSLAIKLKFFGCS